MDKISNKITEIDLKLFNFEWKKLKKLELVNKILFLIIYIFIQQKEQQKYYISNQKSKEKDKKLNKKKIFKMLVEDIIKPTNFLEKNRSDRQEDIKKTLIESIKLKLKLKKQLKAMRDKKIMSESIIKANLKLTNLDDDTIF